MLEKKKKKGTRSIKYLTYDELVRLNKLAKKDNRNQSLAPIVLEKIDKQTVFPVVYSMVHNDIEMRIVLQLNKDASARGLLDISFKEYNNLPVHMV